MQEVRGNIAGLRDTQLAQLAAIYDCPFEPDEYAPRELIEELARHSCALNREIAVYISRDGDVMDVTVGVIDSVPLLDLRLRRNAKRLSFVRCIHTHPGGSAELSDVDIAALRSLMLDSMCAIGVAADGHVTGVSAAFLGEKKNAEDFRSSPAFVGYVPGMRCCVSCRPLHVIPPAEFHSAK